MTNRGRVQVSENKTFCLVTLFVVPGRVRWAMPLACLKGEKCIHNFSRKSKRSVQLGSPRRRQEDSWQRWLDLNGLLYEGLLSKSCCEHRSDISCYNVTWKTVYSLILPLWASKGGLWCVYLVSVYATVWLRHPTNLYIPATSLFEQWPRQTNCIRVSFLKFLGVLNE